MTKEKQDDSLDSAQTPAGDAGVPPSLSPPEASQLGESQLRELMDSLPQLAWTSLAEGSCDYLSRQWIEYTGLPEAVHLGYGWLMQLHPDDRERVKAEWAATVGGGVAFDIEFRIRRKDGVHRWFRTRAIPLRDTSGKITKWYGSCSDIEDYKSTEEALRTEVQLREDESRYRMLFDSSEDALMVVETPSMRFSSGNAATVAMFRAQDEAEFASKSPPELSPERQPDGQSSAKKAKEMVEIALREGSNKFEWSHRRLDGEVFPANGC